MSDEAKERCNQLLGPALDFAEQMLNKHREFFPFASALDSGGNVVLVATWSGSDKPSAPDLIEEHKAALRHGAQSGEYQTTAIAVDMMVTDPLTGKKQDAVGVFLEDKQDYAVEVYFRYKFEGLFKKKVCFESPTGSLGKRSIFE